MNQELYQTDNFNSIFPCVTKNTDTSPKELGEVSNLEYKEAESEYISGNFKPETAYLKITDNEKSILI